MRVGSVLKRERRPDCRSARPTCRREQHLVANHGDSEGWRPSRRCSVSQREDRRSVPVEPARRLDRVPEGGVRRSLAGQRERRDHAGSAGQRLPVQRWLPVVRRPGHMRHLDRGERSGRGLRRPPQPEPTVEAQIGGGSWVPSPVRRRSGGQPRHSCRRNRGSRRHPTNPGPRILLREQQQVWTVSNSPSWPAPTATKGRSRT